MAEAMRVDGFTFEYAQGLPVGLVYNWPDEAKVCGPEDRTFKLVSWIEGVGVYEVMSLVRRYCMGTYGAGLDREAFEVLKRCKTRADIEAEIVMNALRKL